MRGVRSSVEIFFHSNCQVKYLVGFLTFSLSKPVLQRSLSLSLCPSRSHKRFADSWGRVLPWRKPRAALLIIDNISRGGSIMPLNRHGVNKTENPSPLMRCAFEETMDVLCDAAGLAQS